jgi:hypothetical protein
MAPFLEDEPTRLAGPVTEIEERRKALRPLLRVGVNPIDMAVNVVYPSPCSMKGLLALKEEYARAIVERTWPGRKQ